MMHPHSGAGSEEPGPHRCKHPHRGLLRWLLRSGCALLTASIAFADGGTATNVMEVCGTGSDRRANALATILYRDSMRQEPGLGRRLAASFDVGDVAVIEDDGTILSQVNLFDLGARAFRFEPLDLSHYRLVASTARFDASGGNPVSLGDDDSLQLGLGFVFTFFGERYSSVYLNSDGNLTFGDGDSSTTPRDLGRFISGPPRVAPLFTDLNPDGGGIRVRSDSDGIVFSWTDVSSFSVANTNNFAVKLFASGTIEFVYGSRVDSRESVVGISPGLAAGGVSAVDYTADLPVSMVGSAVAEIFAARSSLSEPAVARKFFQSHPDSFDHLVVFLAYNFNLGGAYAYEINVKNEISGIGLDQIDNSALYGSQGRLRSFLMMGSLDGPGRYPDAPDRVYLGTNSTLSLMGHESGHRWLAFSRFRDGQTNSRSVLGRQNAHWSFFFDSDASVMEGNDIEDRGAAHATSRFATVAASRTFSALDQYLMGLIGKDEVPPMFVVEGPTGTSRFPSSAPSVGVTFGGQRKEFTIDDVIAANGERFPPAHESPKVFRQAFILLTRVGQQAIPEQIAKVQAIRDAWVKFFGEQTQYHGWITTHLQETLSTTPRPVFFPALRGNRYVGITLANWGSTPADVLLTAVDSEGNSVEPSTDVINPRMVTLPPRGQVALLTDQIHGAPPVDGWIRGDSSSSEIAAFFLHSDEDPSRIAGTRAGSEGAAELYFGRIEDQTRVTVVNPNGVAAKIELQLIDRWGATLATESFEIVPWGLLSEEARDLLPILSSLQTIKESVSGYIRLTADRGVQGYQEIRIGGSSYMLPGQPRSEATTLYAAQAVYGSPNGGTAYFSELNLINTGTDPRSIEALLVGPTGLPVPGMMNPANFHVAAGEQIRTDLTRLFGMTNPTSSPDFTEGSLVVSVDDAGIIGDLLIGDAGGTRFRASFPLERAAASDLVFPHVAQTGSASTHSYFTGVAIYNPNPAAAILDLDVFSSNGTMTGATRFLLRGFNRIAATLPELVPGLNTQLEGHIRIRVSGGAVVACATIGDQSLQSLVSLPAERIHP